MNKRMKKQMFMRADGGVLYLYSEPPDLSLVESNEARDLLSRFYSRLDSILISNARRMADNGGVRSIRCAADADLMGDILIVKRTYELTGDIACKYTETDSFKLLPDGRIKTIKYSKNQRLFRHGTDKNGIFNKKSRKKSGGSIRDGQGDT